jgi:2-polyprenyl-3-methyl-5-hydroxy-6-metoxy-1,4-benzoquinol methylase
MDPISERLSSHYRQTFEQYGATPKGVDWTDAWELQVRYDKMLKVMDQDRGPQQPSYSLLDVGCGWGGLCNRIQELKMPIIYVGIDTVEEMIVHATAAYPMARFAAQDVFRMQEEGTYDYVVCNAILTQKLDVSIVDMERYAKRLITAMYRLCRHGIAFNMMSTRVNYMVPNLYYQNPSELLAWVLSEISPRARLDHGYSSLASGRGKFFDFTAYVYKDR